MSFQLAEKYKSKLRCAIFGPSGSGKTMSALRIAKGMGGANIAVIDSENGSASKYADKFKFDVVELKKKNIDEYIQYIHDASYKEYGVLIIDSLSHAWQELLEDVDRLANTKYKGNTWSAWSEGTPKQKELVNAIHDCRCHVIVTMRSKTLWEAVKKDNGKVVPLRVGLAPEQGKGIEYEFDMLMELTTDHVATVIKDRTSKFQDEIISLPSEEFGKSLIAWLNKGVDKPLVRGDFEAAQKAIDQAETPDEVEKLHLKLRERSWGEGQYEYLDEYCMKRIDAIYLQKREKHAV